MLRRSREAARFEIEGNRSCTEEIETWKDSVRTIIVRDEARVNQN